MKRRLGFSPHMVFVSGKEFVRAVMARLGADGPTALVKAMGWQDEVNQASLISKWTGGTANPSYVPTMQMLEKCGWLKVDAKTRAALVSEADKEQARSGFANVLQATREEPTPDEDSTSQPSRKTAEQRRTPAA